MTSVESLEQLEVHIQILRDQVRNIFKIWGEHNIEQKIPVNEQLLQQLNEAEVTWRTFRRESKKIQTKPALIQKKKPEILHLSGLPQKHVETVNQKTDTIASILTYIRSNASQLQINVHDMAGNSMIDVSIPNMMTLLFVLSPSFQVDQMRVLHFQEVNTTSAHESSFVSKFKLFRVISAHCIHTFHHVGKNTDIKAEIVRSFLVWFSSYVTLFTMKCSNCHTHLSYDGNNACFFPPCIRTIADKPKAYHLACI